MSSHHIVRENQEPALIIANGEACSAELLGQLLEWSPYVVVLDGAIHRVLDLGIKIDALLGDFDRQAFDPESIRQRQYPIDIIHTPDQNKTDLEKAFDYLIERGHRAANVVWATGRRADHTITNLTNVVRYRDQLAITLADDHSRVFLLPRIFEKWYPAATPLSLIPVGTVTGISTKNLKYNLDDEALILGYRTGSSNEADHDGLVQIRYATGDLLLMECWD
ncbi:MAG: thiamine diphosphokinase [Cytophagaceae bacterium]|nr:thiamine diphosphokinase [Cytophagaceae bacterium]